jgi:hypothetical protein
MSPFLSQPLGCEALYRHTVTRRIYHFWTALGIKKEAVAPSCIMSFTKLWPQFHQILMRTFNANPIKAAKKLNAMKVSRSSRLDLLKHQHPAAKGISARVKLMLNALSATTIIISANSIHMVRGLTGQWASLPSVVRGKPGPRNGIGHPTGCRFTIYGKVSPCDIKR